MKTRNGFVSNSSTSSFIVMGCIFDNTDEFKNALTPKALAEIEKEVEGQYESVDEWIKENAARRYYPDNSFAWGTYLGSVDYIEGICSFETIKNAYENEVKDFERLFGKDHNFPVELVGVRAEC